MWHCECDDKVFNMFVPLDSAMSISPETGHLPYAFHLGNILIAIKLYNIQLLPSYDVYIESCQPEGGCILRGSDRKQSLEGWQLSMFTSYEDNDCFIIPKLL